MSNVFKRFLKFTGISYCTNSISARQRWCTGHSKCRKIISHIVEITGLKKKQDVTADLQKCSIKKIRSHLEKFIQLIEESVNPFKNISDKDSY